MHVAVTSSQGVGALLLGARAKRRAALPRPPATTEPSAMPHAGALLASRAALSPGACAPTDTMGDSSSRARPAPRPR